MAKMILFHGSQKIVSKPLYGLGKPYNDYGPGFYCTQDIELAKEWACPTTINGFCNSYELKTTNLKILNLLDQKYCPLHWLTILINNRKFDLGTPLSKEAALYLTKHFLPDIHKYDVIRGYRADDSYFSFAKAFLTNQISYAQLIKAIKLGNLGEQIVLKSKLAFDSVKFIKYEIADGKTYSLLRANRIQKARDDYNKVVNKADIQGLYMLDILQKEIKKNDPRLQ